MNDGLTLSEVSFEDLDSLAAAVARLREEGWGAVPRDWPERGVRGFYCFREGEDGRWLRWNVFGRELTPSVKVCATWQDFVTELEFRVGDEMEKCDDLEARQVGFASYGRAAVSGVCEVVRLPVDALVAGGAEARGRLLEMLSRVRSPGEPLLRQVAARGPSPG